jgi:hypothetical protein
MAAEGVRRWRWSSHPSLSDASSTLARCVCVRWLLILSWIHSAFLSPDIVHVTDLGVVCCRRSRRRRLLKVKEGAPFLLIFAVALFITGGQEDKPFCSIYHRW